MKRKKIPGNIFPINSSKFFVRLSFLIIIIGGSSACKKAVEVAPPKTNLVAATTFQSNSSAIAAVTGIFQTLDGTDLVGGDLGNDNFATIAGLSADELTLYPSSSSNLQQAYTNSLYSQTSPFPFWTYLYNTIYDTNAAINGISNSSGVTQPVKNQLLGECYFIRAFCNFYLVNVFGNVPLVTTTNYQINNSVTRSSIADVYQQIITDLKSSDGLLSANYVSLAVKSISDKTFPNKGAVEALLARVYLYNRDWANAETKASSVISNYSYQLDSDLNSVFLTNSTEAIWQLPTLYNTTYDTPDGYIFILTSGPDPVTNPVYLSPQVLNAFETNDNRMADWVGSSNGYFFAYKYKQGRSPSSVTENYMVLRLAEQYLIRAEARAEQNETSAVNDLDVIRNRAGLPNYSGATDQKSLLAAIMHENQIEFFAEWGHRWLDLKRTNTVDSVMSIVTPLKGGTWSSYKQLFPIPLSDIKIDPKLGQNPGYN